MGPFLLRATSALLPTAEAGATAAAASSSTPTSLLAAKAQPRREKGPTSPVPTAEAGPGAKRASSSAKVDDAPTAKWARLTEAPKHLSAMP